METICPKCGNRISGQAFALGRVVKVGNYYYHMVCLQETTVTRKGNEDEDDGA